jgi:DNA-binding NtrC family response regulator
VRELQNVLERAVILCGEEGTLQPSHLGFTSLDTTDSKALLDFAPDDASTSDPLTLDELEKRQILHVLTRCQGNRTHAAKKLGISIRTLRNKLHEYGVTPDDQRADAGAEA